MCYCPTPTLHLNLALTGDGAFIFSLEKTHSVWFISVLNYGDTENVLINPLLLVIPMSYPCHYTNLCPHKPHKHATTHTHTHTHAQTRTHTHTHDTHAHTHTHTHTPHTHTRTLFKIPVLLFVKEGNPPSVALSIIDFGSVSGPVVKCWCSAFRREEMINIQKN